MGSTLRSAFTSLKADIKKKLDLKYYRYAQEQYLKKICKKGKANVVFLAATLSMWRYQALYDILKKDSRFELFIVIYPLEILTEESNENNFNVLKAFFEKRKMSFLRLQDLPKESGLKSLNPDIIFYAQQYDSSLPQYVDASYFYDRLIGYIPYGLNTLKHSWNYNTRFQNLGWRMYYANELLYNDAIIMTDCKGDNVVVVGDPHGDDFCKTSVQDPWQKAGGKKRIIWAPHFQIVANDWFNRPSFLWTYDVMLQLAVKYQSQIHIAFKPHPRLYSELCKHKDWGEQKAKEYYDKWRSMPNTQYEDGEYIDLFKTSDALIHGCGSFTAEYQYTQKPCMYLTLEADAIKSELCDFGMRCFNNHYIGTSAEDIENFILQVVLEGYDEKYADREKLYREVLQPINGRSSAENIYNDLVLSIFD